MRRRGISQPLAALALVAAAGLWLATAGFAVVDAKPDMTQFADLPPLTAGHTLSQSFTAPAGGLSRIDISFDKKAAAAAGDLVMELAAAGGNGSGGPAAGSAVRRVETGAAPNPVDGTVSFAFAPLPDSAGRRYILRLRLVSSGGEPAHPVSVPVRGGEEPPLIQDGKSSSTGLALTLYHESGIRGLIDRLEPFHPPVLGNPVFLIAVFLTGAGSFGWLLWQLAAGPGVKRRHPGKASAHM